MRGKFMNPSLGCLRDAGAGNRKQSSFKRVSMRKVPEQVSGEMNQITHFILSHYESWYVEKIDANFYYARKKMRNFARRKNIFRLIEFVHVERCVAFVGDKSDT